MVEVGTLVRMTHSWPGTIASFASASIEIDLVVTRLIVASILEVDNSSR